MPSRRDRDDGEPLEHSSDPGEQPDLPRTTDDHERTDAGHDVTRAGGHVPDGGSGDDPGCPKCGHTETEVDDIATTGTGLSKFFDVQNRRFRVVSCTSCGYAELYKGGHTSDLVDLFLG